MAQTGFFQARSGWELLHLGWPSPMWHLEHMVRGEWHQGGDVPREMAAAACRTQVPPLAR